LSAELLQDRAATLRQIEAWARTEYGPALGRVASLGDGERDGIVAALSRFTGLDPTAIDRNTLIVSRQQFAEQLLRDKKQVLARFDTREVEGPARRTGRDLTILTYLRSTLGFKTDLAYQGLEDGFTPTTGQRVSSVGARWNYNQAPQAEPGSATTVPARPANLDGPPGGAQPWLRRAMAINPSLRAFVAAGLYDPLNSCAANAFLVGSLEPSIQRNVSANCYEGGHMMYDDPAVRVQLSKDVIAFLKAASVP
jgi:hypothetical protein